MRVAVAVLVLGAIVPGLARAQDAGTRDAGARDGGVRAAGPRDAGPRDAGPRDAGIVDAGRRDGSVPDGSVAEPPPEIPLRAVARDPAAAVASRGRDTLLTAGEVAAAINARPSALRNDFRQTSELDREGLELTRERMLAAEARRRGLERDPRVRRELDRVLVRALLAPLADASAREPVTAAEIQRYYDSHTLDFTRPERVRTSVVVLEDEPTARRVLAQLRRSPPGAFRWIVRRYSTDRRSRNRGGDAGWWDHVGGGTDPALVEGGFSLTTAGQLLDHVVRTDDELFYVIRLDERRAAELIPLSDLRITIESRIRRERLGALEDHVATTTARQTGLQNVPASRLVRMVPERPAAARPAGTTRDAGR